MEELKAIVQRMIDAGEPEEKIKEAVLIPKFIVFFMVPNHIVKIKNFKYFKNLFFP